LLQRLDLLQVVPGAEALAGARQDDDAHAPVVLEGIEFLLDGRQHLAGEQVHLLRTVHRQGADAVAILAQEDGLCGLWNSTHVSIALVDLARSRRTNFWILPVEVFGSSPNTTARGALNLARCSRQKSMSSFSVTCELFFSSTKAHGVSPHFSSGRATTAAARTAGWR